MTIRDAPPSSALMIPDTAPFSMEQRAWLNGFFAGLLSLDAQVAPLEGELPVAAAKALAGGNADDGAPWHDAAMPIDERMQLAESRPLPTGRPSKASRRLRWRHWRYTACWRWTADR